MKSITKIQFPEEFKRIFTLEELDICKKIAYDMKENADNGKIDFDWEVAMAVYAGSGHKVSDSNVIFAKAEFAKNNRIYDYYYNESKTVDIYFTIYAYSEYYGFYDIRAYLSDIWQYSSVDNDTSRFFWVRHFVEDK